VATEEKASMTKEPYRKTVRVSPSGKHFAARTRRPTPPKKTPVATTLLKDAYQYLSPTTGENPIDATIDDLPDVVLARQKMKQASARLRKRAGRTNLFVAYEDAWSYYCIVRNEHYFNKGFEFGARFAPVLRDSATLVRALRPVLREIQAVHASLPERMLAGGLMEIARAFLIPPWPTKDQVVAPCPGRRDDHG
jgi:hypothetical protein